MCQVNNLQIDNPFHAIKIFGCSIWFLATVFKIIHSYYTENQALVVSKDKIKHFRCPRQANFMLTLVVKIPDRRRPSQTSKFYVHTHRKNLFGRNFILVTFYTAGYTGSDRCTAHTALGSHVLCFLHQKRSEIWRRII